MDDTKERRKRYNKFLQGRPVDLADIEEKMMPFAIHKNGVQITPDVLALINLENDTRKNQTLVLTLNDVPLVTDLTTQELISEYHQRTFHHGKKAKDVLQLFLNKQLYHFPVMSEEMILSPLWGSVKKNSDFINYALLDSIRKESPHSTSLSFCNHLEITIPMTCRTMSDRSQSTLFNFLVYYDARRLISGHTQHILSDCLKNWKGDYIRSVQSLLPQQMTTSSGEHFSRCEQIIASFHLMKGQEPSMSLFEYLMEYGIDFVQHA